MATETIGAAGTRTTVALWIANIPADLSTAGEDHRGEHLDEETSYAGQNNMTTDTNGYNLILTAQSGAEHDGDGDNTFATGNGARVTFGTSDWIGVSESSPDYLSDTIEISKLAIDVSGGNNEGISLMNASGTINVNRNLIRGNADSWFGITMDYQAENVNVTNNICYGIGASGSEGGIRLYRTGSTTVYNIYNNTMIGNYFNFIQDDSSFNGTCNFKNNLMQAHSGGADYQDDDVSPGITTSKNITQDATSPDGAPYASLTVHDTTSSFIDYSGNDFKLVEGGTDNTTLDDGDDLSGTFTDDIIGQTRSTWYIGASEIVAAGGGGLPAGSLGLLGVGI